MNIFGGVGQRLGHGVVLCWIRSPIQILIETERQSSWEFDCVGFYAYVVSSHATRERGEVSPLWEKGMLQSMSESDRNFQINGCISHNFLSFFLSFF